MHPPIAQGGGVEDVFDDGGQIDLVADGESALGAGAATAATGG